MSSERIQKLIAQAGICSRRKAEEMILQGRVKLNRKIVREQGLKADPEKDKIQVDGQTIEFQKKIYLLMNKPDKMITSHSDEAGRPVVYSLIKEERRLVTAGRLDYHTEGVLLFTNDGELVHRLTHPSSMVPKEYEVKVKGRLSAEQIKNIEHGVLLEDGPTQPVMVERVRSTGLNTWYQFILTEGRNREVRRIVEAVGATVLKLKRTSFAGLRIDEMLPGAVRPLSAAEILMLYEAAGLYNERGAKKPAERTPRAAREAAARSKKKPTPVRKGRPPAKHKAKPGEKPSPKSSGTERDSVGSGKSRKGKGEDDKRGRGRKKEESRGGRSDRPGRGRSRSQESGRGKSSNKRSGSKRSR